MPQSSLRPPASAAEEAGEKTILVVAGASGSGKTTFMEMLSAGKLEELESVLPSGARHWPQFGHRRSQEPDRAHSFVLHYTIVYPRLMGFELAMDPCLAPLERAEKAVVVTIHADSAVVRDRYVARRAERAKARGALRTIIKRVRRRLQEPSPRADLASLYADPEWVGACYREWDEYLLGQARLRDLVMIDVGSLDTESFPKFEIQACRTPGAGSS
jgi:hypothetical protein